MEPTTARTWARNPAEWNALIGRYLPQLKRFAERHLTAQLRGTTTADDLVQEVVLSGIRQLHRLELRHEQAFLSYLLTSIRHRIVDEIRRTRRQPAFVLHDNGDWNVDPSVSPLQRLITRENLRRYAKALACLADRDRQLIMLRVLRGLSCLDVAVRLGMRSEAAVHMAVKRALRRLEKSLNEADSPSMSQASIHTDSRQQASARERTTNASAGLSARVARAASPVAARRRSHHRGFRRNCHVNPSASSRAFRSRVRVPDFRALRCV